MNLAHSPSMTTGNLVITRSGLPFARFISAILCFEKSASAS